MSEILKRDNARKVAADAAFVDYNFGKNVLVEDTSGWEYSTNGSQWVMPVYITNQVHQDVPSTRLTFTVDFIPMTATVKEAYAMDGKGQFIGSPASDELVSAAASAQPESARPKSLDASFVKEISTYNTGGGCMVDFVTMADGRVLTLNDEAIGVYESKEAFFDSDDGDKALQFMWLNDLKFTDLQAAVMVLKHENEDGNQINDVYACIRAAGRSFDVLLTEGMSAAESLKMSAIEMRKQAQRMIEEAQLIEAAAKII